MKSAILGATALALALGGSTMVPNLVESAAGAPVLPVSPDNQVMVVSVNLAETFNDADNAEQRELGNFARRLKANFLAQTLQMPDLVLVQEVNQASAEATADLLSRYLYGSGSSAFQVVVPPAAGKSSIWNNTTNPRERRAEAVIMNTVTMNSGTGLGSDRRHFALESAKDDSKSASGWTWHYAASHRAVEKDGSGRIAVTSVRMVKNTTFKAQPADAGDPDGTTLGTSYKGAWSNDLVEMHSTMSQPTSVIAGDFNEDKCIDPSQPVATWLIPIEGVGVGV